MIELLKELGVFVSVHWAALVLVVVAGGLGYIVGVSNPLYCARCRRHLTAEEVFRSTFKSSGE